MSRRTRANSFRGKEMHQNLRGACEVVNSSATAPTEDEEFEERGGKLVRKV